MNMLYRKLKAKWELGLFVCIGLDPVYENLPECIRNRFDVDLDGKAAAVLEFNKNIVDYTSDYACAYKPNFAFYLKSGHRGVKAFEETVAYIKSRESGGGRTVIIGDGKWGDIGSSNEGYVDFFDLANLDAATINPYLGEEANTPFLRSDKGFFILCRTSNHGAGEFQDLMVVNGDSTAPLYQVVAKNVASKWNKNGNCGLVVGATYPEEMAIIREIVGDDVPILIPGIGAQGGDLEAAVKAGINSKGGGILVNSSRGITGVSKGEDYAEAAGRAAKELNDQINSYRFSV